MNTLFFNYMKRTFFNLAIIPLTENKIKTKSKMIGYIIVLFATAFIAGCNGNNSEGGNKTTDSVAPSNVQRDDDGTNRIYQGMEMIKSGNDMVNKGGKANDRSMINNGMALMDKGMEMVKSGRSIMDSPQHENEVMDDNMGMSDSAKRTGGKDMDMGDYGMNMIHQGIAVAKSGKMLTEHAQK